MVERPVYAGQPVGGGTPQELPKSKCELDRDEHGHWFAEACTRSEPPLLRSLDGFLVEAECRIERPYDLDLANGAIRQDDTLEQDGALNLCPHRVSGVLRFYLSQRFGQENTVAGTISTTAGPAAESVAKT